MQFVKLAAFLATLAVAATTQAAPIPRQLFDDNWSFKLMPHRIQRN